MCDSTFGALGVPDDLVARLGAAGIVEPFPIQAAVIADALAGRDVTGRAPTGSGKTLAFGVPLVANLRGARRRQPTALVLAPTRELARQIAEEIAPLAQVRGHAVAAVYGGVGHGAQRRALDAGVELVVACPGRLEDLISMGALSLGEVRQVVVDEADRMADMGFLPAVRRLIDQTHTQRQTLLFSATLDGAVGKLAAAVQRQPARHEVGPTGPDVSAARHVFWSVEREGRSELTARVVREVGSTMVFCRTRHGADRVAKQLARLGVTSAPIHGGRSQPQRDRALKAFVEGAVSVLVATDVAARGVHVDDVAAVVHYDPAADAATYVHRSGRTARAGASGVVVSLVESGTERDARALQREIGVAGTIGAPQMSELTARPVEDDNRVTATAAAVTAAPTAVTAVATTTAAATADRQVRAVTADRRVGTVTADRQVGTVRFFHDGRGYGFIDAGEGADLFVHHANVATRISKGQRVEYGVRPGRKGLEAFDVVAV